MAFYVNKNIQRKVAEIKERLYFDGERCYRYEGYIRGNRKETDNKLPEDLLKGKLERNGIEQRVFVLSASEDGEGTIDLGKLIENDLKNEAGRPIAFTQNQRYTTLEHLKAAKTTSDLVRS